MRRALKQEPQPVTRHGRKAVLVLSAEDYVRRDAGVAGFLDATSPIELAI